MLVHPIPTAGFCHCIIWTKFQFSVCKFNVSWKIKRASSTNRSTAYGDEMEVITCVFIYFKQRNYCLSGTIFCNAAFGGKTV